MLVQRRRQSTHSAARRDADLPVPRPVRYSHRRELTWVDFTGRAIPLLQRATLDALSAAHTKSQYRYQPAFRPLSDQYELYNATYREEGAAAVVDNAVVVQLRPSFNHRRSRCGLKRL